MKMKEKDRKHKNEGKSQTEIEEKKQDEIKNIESEEMQLSETELLKKQNEEYKDAFLRKSAEFENYKKRTEIEFSNIFKYSSKKFIKELLPVFDDLSRAVDSIEKGETKDFETLKTGVITVAAKLKNILEKEGLMEIDCLNKEFDVDTCDALIQIPRNDVKPHTVVEVVEKGYYFKDKVLRHAKVVVSSEPENKQE
jgi:molecular chaperone GrpE